MAPSVQFLETPSESLSKTTFNHEHMPMKDNRNMNDESRIWVEEFQTLFDSKITTYTNGLQNAKSMFSREEKYFLRSIGATPQEFFDFVEDWCDDGAPDLETALAIATIRRNYFLQEQHGYRVVA